MRLIDADKAISDYAHYRISHSYDACDLEDILTECPTIEAIEKSDYENRLKADLVAILEEIDLEMSEQSFGIQTEPWEVVEELRKKIIRQKINSLKGKE